MSNQESSSVLTELEQLVRVGPTGTTHVLTLNVRAGLDVTISDPALPIRNGDAVVWRINPLATTDTVEISFSPVMLSVPARVPGTNKVRVDVSEEAGVGARTVTESYSITLNGTKLPFISTLVAGDPISPQLVIDNMGGM